MMHMFGPVYKNVHRELGSRNVYNTLYYISDLLNACWDFSFVAEERRSPGCNRLQCFSRKC